MDDSRRLARASQEFFLRSAVLLARAFPNDLIRGVIWVAINSGNTGHLMDDAALDRQFGDEGTPTPEDIRRPVSRLAVANSLSMPYETARRHINALVRDGWCVEVPGKGVLVNADKIEEPVLRELRRANAMNIRRFLKRLGPEITAD